MILPKCSPINFALVCMASFLFGCGVSELYMYHRILNGPVVQGACTKLPLLEEQALPIPQGGHVKSLIRKAT